MSLCKGHMRSCLNTGNACLPSGSRRPGLFLSPQSVPATSLAKGRPPLQRRRMPTRPAFQVAAAMSMDPEDLPSPSTTTGIQQPDLMSEVAQQNLLAAANACRRCGWIAFWTQLVLTSVSAVIVLFSMAFTSQAGPQISLYLTLFAIAMGFLSTFWSYGYTRLARRLRAFLDATSGALAGRGTSTATTTRGVRRSDVIGMLEKGAIFNALGAGASLLALQATIGLLVAKTLTTASVNPFLASSSNSWNPVLAFDVFNVQATTNALLSHFFSLLISLWLLRIVANRPSPINVVARSSP